MKSSEPWPIWLKGAWQLMGLLLLALQGPGFVDSLLVRDPEPIDFAQEWVSARNWWLGAAVYADQRVTLPRYLGLAEPEPGQQREWYIIYNAHPPAAVLICLPLGAVADYRLAAVIWNGLSLALLGLAVLLMVRELKLQVSPWLIVPLLGLLLLYNPLRQQVNQGQMNGVLLLVLTLAWRGWRHGRAQEAGFWLAVAAVLKLFPAFLFLLLLAQREWRGLLVGATTGLALTLIGVLVLGVAAHEDYAFKVVPAVHEFRAGKLNASLPGLFTKLLVGSEFEKVRPWLAAPTLAWGLTALMGLVLTGLVAWAARPGGAGDRDQLFCLGLVSMTLLSPITWDHSLLLLTLPILWVSQRQTGLAGRLGLAAVVLIFGFHHHGFWKWAEQGGWLPGVFGPLEVLGLASLLCYGQVLLLGLVWAAPGRGQP